MVKKLHGCNFLTRALPIGAKLNLLPKKQKNPSTTQYSLAKETRSLSLSKGTFSKKTFVCKQERKKLHGFFYGLQNRHAILHAANPPSLARYCLSRKKKSLPASISLSKRNTFSALAAQRQAARRREHPKKRHLLNGGVLPCLLLQFL